MGISTTGNFIVSAACYLLTKGSDSSMFVCNYRTLISFGRTIMQALGLLQLAKRRVLARNNVEHKPVALAIIKLHLSEGISQSVHPSVHLSVSQSVSRNSRNY